MAEIHQLRKRAICDDGSAVILITLRDGNITVHHGTQPDLLLAEKRNAPPGTWDALWECIRSLGIKETGNG